MRFWDSSAIVSLLVQQAATDAVQAEFERDPQLLVWWATAVECVSALTRIERDGGLDPSGVRAANERLTAIAASWQEILPTERIRLTASRLLRTHPLRAGGAFQLAAALIAADGDPRTLELVTLDDRLADAAAREGFRAVSPA